MKSSPIEIPIGDDGTALPISQYIQSINFQNLETLNQAQIEEYAKQGNDFI